MIHTSVVLLDYVRQMMCYYQLIFNILTGQYCTTLDPKASVVQFDYIFDTLLGDTLRILTGDTSVEGAHCA